MADFDWSTVTRAAHEWLAKTTERADKLYLPMGTDAAILEMAAEIYDVDAVTWPVEVPTFANEPPVGRAVPDRDVDDTVDVLNGADNERGLPFPLYADANQRDWQFQFCGEKEANERARKLYDVATGTLRLLYVWAMLQMMSPSVTLNVFDKEWKATGLSPLTKYENDYATWLVNRPSVMRNQNQHNVGQLWIITGTVASARQIMPDRVAQIIQPMVLTGDKEQPGRGSTFGQDDRVFYQHWNPAKQIELAARCRIPEAVIPSHQLGPHTTCHCLLCENGSLTETLWSRVTAEVEGRAIGRVSRRNPNEQSIPKGPGSAILDGGPIDLGNPLTVEQIQSMDMATYSMYRERLLAQMRYLSQAQIKSRSEARKFLDLGP